MAYLGKTPSQAVRSRYYFTASGGETSLSGADDNTNTLTFTDGNYVDVSLNGVALVAGTDYNTTTANTIGGLTALVASDVVEVIVYDTFSVFGGEFRGDISLGDNVKAKFGASDDLQIYHDGSNSYINESGTGNLFIDAANYLTLRNTNGESYVAAQANGYVQLFYNGSQKLATTSTGADITGTLTADGLTVDGDGKISSTAPKLFLTETDTVDVNTRITSTGGVLYFQSSNDAENAHITRQTIDHSTGDISFYEDTGTTAKFFWDASAESLGIGTSSPQGAAHVKGETAALGVDDYPQLTIETAATSGAANTGGGILFLNHDGTGGSFGGSIQSLKENGTSGNSAHYMRFSTRANGGNVTERMRIDSSGNLLVGKTSAATNVEGGELRENGQVLAVATNVNPFFGARLGSDGDIAVFRKDSTTVGSLSTNAGAFVVKGASTTAPVQLQTHDGNEDIEVDPDGFIKMETAGYERLRIDSSGRVMIATSTPETRGITFYGNGVNGMYVRTTSTTNYWVTRDGQGAGSGNIATIYSDTALVGSISVSSTTTSYNTSSDHRLKENVTDVTDGITRVKQLEPKRFNFIADPDRTVDGFLAHQAQAVVPEAVTGTHNEVDDDGNAVMQGIDQSKLVPLLTAALKEAITKIEALETEMTSVKARLDALEAN